LEALVDIEGNLVVDPNAIKGIAQEHFCTLFQEEGGSNVESISNGFPSLDDYLLLST